MILNEKSYVTNETYTLRTDLLQYITELATSPLEKLIIGSMSKQQEQKNTNDNNLWYKEPQIVVTLVIGILSAAATIIGSLISAYVD
jgi:hypothetical protein